MTFAEAALQAFAAVEAAEAAAPELRESLAEICAQSLAMLRSLSSSHPNRRKVYTAVLGRLLVLILACHSSTGLLPLQERGHTHGHAMLICPHGGSDACSSCLKTFSMFFWMVSLVMRGRAPLAIL